MPTYLLFLCLWIAVFLSPCMNRHLPCLVKILERNHKGGSFELVSLCLCCQQMAWQSIGEGFPGSESSDNAAPSCYYLSSTLWLICCWLPCCVCLILCQHHLLTQETGSNSHQCTSISIQLNSTIAFKHEQLASAHASNELAVFTGTQDRI
jgi:hypothetical protein